MKPAIILILALIMITGCDNTRNCIIQPNPAPSVELSCPECTCPAYEEVDCIAFVAGLKRDNDRLEILFEK